MATPDKKRYILIGRLRRSVNVCESMDHVAGHETFFLFRSRPFAPTQSISFCDCFAKIGPPLWGLKWWCGYGTSPTRWNFRNSHIHPDTPTTFRRPSSKNNNVRENTWHRIQTWSLWSGGKSFFSVFPFLLSTSPGKTLSTRPHIRSEMKNFVLIQFVNLYLGHSSFALRLLRGAERCGIWNDVEVNRLAFWN